MTGIRNPDIFVSARAMPFSAGIEIIVYKRVGFSEVSILTIDHQQSIEAKYIVYRWSSPRSSFELLKQEDVFLQILDFAPQLVAALSDQGVTLPEKSFVEGKLGAVEAHLKDMQRLVFEESKS